MTRPRCCVRADLSSRAGNGVYRLADLVADKDDPLHTLQFELQTEGGVRVCSWRLVADQRRGRGRGLCVSAWRIPAGRAARQQVAMVTPQDRHTAPDRGSAPGVSPAAGPPQPDSLAWTMARRTPVAGHRQPSLRAEVVDGHRWAPRRDSPPRHCYAGATQGNQDEVMLEVEVIAAGPPRGRAGARQSAWRATGRRWPSTRWWTIPTTPTTSSPDLATEPGRGGRGSLTRASRRLLRPWPR